MKLRTLGVVCALVVVGVVAARTAWAQSCSGNCVSTCAYGCAGTGFCSQSMSGTFFDTFCPPFDTFEPNKFTCSEMSSCAASGLPLEDCGCSQEYVTFVGLCQGMEYSRSHSSCCQLAT
jgi:hypothetical protein